MGGKLLKMTERAIENKCRLMAKEAGRLCLKWTSPGNPGVPDRILIGGGSIWFVEFKRPGGRLSPLQRKMLKQLANLGANVAIIDSPKDFVALLYDTASSPFDPNGYLTS